MFSQSITPSQHRKLLQKHRHLRYMWIPYTDDVVVVTNDVVKEVRKPLFDSINSYPLLYVLLFRST